MTARRLTLTLLATALACASPLAAPAGLPPGPERGGILNQEDVRRVVLFIRQTFQRQP